MIYCFKACGSVCTGCGKVCRDSCDACGKTCEGCGNLCGQSCKACDDVLSGCCKALCDPITKVFERPLGAYAVMSMLVNIPVAACAVAGLTRVDVQQCRSRPLVAFCVIDAALAIMHMAFAFYLQKRLFRGLQDRELAMAAGSKPGQQNVQARAADVMNYAGHIVLYDVGFCLYIFVFVFSVAFNCFGFSWLSLCDVHSTTPYAAAGLLVLFFVATMHFALLWVFVLSCQACCERLGAHNGGIMRFLLGKRIARAAGARVDDTPVHTVHAKVLGVPRPGDEPQVARAPAVPVMQAMPAPSAPPQQLP